MLLYRRGDAESVSAGLEMSDIFIFFGEGVGVVEAACDVFDFHKIVLDLFSNCLFSNLNISYAFCAHVV